MDKILRVKMGSKPEYSIEEVGDYAGIGGRALTSKVIFTEVPPLCHPLGPENKLVIAPGLMSGSAAAISGRLSVGCKSPLTGTIKESNSGGQAAQVLARIGFAAIILEGEASEGKLYTLVIKKDSVEIVSADDIAGLNNYAAVEKLIAKYGEKCAYMTIGSAGERKMANSTIAVTDMELRPTRHCGRGGVGAVMACKGVKALVLDDAGCSIRKPVNADAFKAANKEFIAGIKKHSVSGQGLPAYGTNVLANIINEAGGFPTNNFMKGQFGKVYNISGETQAETETKRGGLATHGCHRGCVIQCSGTYVDKDGNYISKQPEYETVWAHGANCGIDDLDAIARMDRMDDDFGLDTIEMGSHYRSCHGSGALRIRRRRRGYEAGTGSRRRNAFRQNPRKRHSRHSQGIRYRESSCR